jgi:hypothetical protein
MPPTYRKPISVAMNECPLLALSGHGLLHCTCLLLTQSGHHPVMPFPRRHSLADWEEIDSFRFGTCGVSALRF